MKRVVIRRKLSAFFLSLPVLFLMSGGAGAVFAHGGEDHSGEKPKTVATDAGTIAHTSRLGAYEVMFKHPEIEPDAAIAARFFVTKYETNEPAAEGIAPAVEFEAASGAVTAAAVEKTDRAGSFLVKIPALPEGVYTVRAKLTYRGETDTATFSGVEVAAHHHSAAASGPSEMSWARTALIGTVFALVLAMFGLLFFFVRQFAASDEAATAAAVNKETVSA